jgi:LPS sulfotransferase NodH
VAFSSFVVLAGMRTGSNLLEAHLNALPGVACHGEAFNPGFVGKLKAAEAFGMTLAERDADPLRFLRLLQGQGGLNGFRYFADHDPRVWPAVMDDAACAKIVLTRHPLESYVSWKIAQATGQWKLTNLARRQEAKAVFDAREFAGFLDRHRRGQTEILRALQERGQAAFWIGYDDLGEIAVLNGLAAFLGVEGRLAELDPGLLKQNPGPLARKVANPEAMAAAVASTQWIDLDHGPGFEPRRGAAVPSFVAGGPLLYMPMPAGPVDEISAWLAGVGPVVGDFSQKTLRQWRRARPGHRSFTVLRHPLARAWTTFAGPVMGGALPELRRIFARTMGIDLSVAGAGGAAADRRALFLAWLRFAKLTLAGQTAARVAAPMATQTMVLQGFAEQQGPDVVLREARLAEGLAFLAAETGADLPPAPVIPADPGLAVVRDAEIDAAAREAYLRDYTGFGFDG